MGKHLVDAGMSGLVYCGSMGDWPLLTIEQRMEGVERLTKADLPVVVGTGAQNTEQAAALAGHARAGCFWLESRLGFPNQLRSDSTCWLGGGQQGMPKPYSQDLRDRVIDAVERGEMSRRAAARRYAISESVAIKWLERVERDGSREPVGHGGHRASKLMPHRDFLQAARTEKTDVTLQALCDRLSAERGVKADTSMMSRFFRKIGVTFKKRPSSRASRIVPT
jgi:transposase